MRLLTEKELYGLLQRGELPQVCKAQDAKTLKAVGEYLLNAPDDAYYTTILSLLMGEMPEEVKE